MPKRLADAAIFGVATGILGVLLSILPVTLAWEERGGLGWLFAIRGSIPSPEHVAVVSISRESAAAVGQPPEPRDWPRSLHAALIDRLVEYGAEAVIFDLSFEKPSAPEGDELLAAAIRSAGNVILLERVETQILELDGEYSPANAEVEIRLRPIPAFKEVALASAPFTVPRVPKRIGQFWTFGRAAGDTPSLPVVALQAYLLPLYDDLLTGLNTVERQLAAELPQTRAELLDGHDLEAVARTLRGVFRGNRDLAPRILERLRTQGLSNAKLGALESLVAVYAGQSSRYLNYYGPARTIQTLPYNEILRPPNSGFDLAGKVIFVGFSESRQPVQLDAFESVFSQPNGQDLSGVEIGATAFANLLEQTAIIPLPIPQHLLVVFTWGLLLGLIFMALPTGAALVGALGAGTLYAVGSFFAFKLEGLWLPTMTPLLVQLPVALFAALLWNFRRLLLQREKMREVLGHYVPDRVVKRLAQESLGAGASAELLHGTCLFTDAEQYTAVAESMRPEELAALMNDYYEVMFQVVKRHHGVISDIAGDSMVAIWTAIESDSRCRDQACRAALDICAAVAAFNRTRGEHELPTCVGLESGEVFLGDVGAANRYEYRAVGGIVSTASRIQGLNRLLGTKILVSATTLADTGDVLSRDVGTFRLRGKTTPLALHELRDSRVEPRLHVAAFGELRESFGVALASFRQAHWADAQQRFAGVLLQFPDDGPSRYYLGLAAQYREQQPAQWDGIVTITAR